MKKTFTVLTAAMFALSLSACDVDQTEEGSMPDVDVDVEGGNLPEFDVDAPEVEVKMEEKTIEVPVVDVEAVGDAAGEPVTGDE